MDRDLGIGGFALLVGMAAAVGVVAQLVFWRATPHWTGVAAALTFFACGLLISEVWFGWATEEDLQPNIDGLSFDETLLGVFPALLVVFLVWWTNHRRLTRR